jgi:hypothetical protein
MMKKIIPYINKLPRSRDYGVLGMWAVCYDRKDWEWVQYPRQKVEAWQATGYVCPELANGY